MKIAMISLNTVDDMSSMWNKKPRIDVGDDVVEGKSKWMKNLLLDR